MSGFWDSICEKASSLIDNASNSMSQAYDSAKEKIGKAYDSVKETAGKVYDELKGAAHDAYNTARNMVNTGKYALTGIATSTLNGTGELIKSVKTGAIDLCEEAAHWAKPLAKCGKFLQKAAFPLKVLSIGEAGLELYNEHKCKKACEVGCSMALGTGAAAAATVLLAATPVGWAAAGVFAIGAAGAWLGDWIGSKIGDAIDEKPQPSVQKDNVEIIPIKHVKGMKPIKIDVEKQIEVRKAIEIEVKPAIEIRPAIEVKPAEEIRPAIEIRSALPPEFEARRPLTYNTKIDIQIKDALLYSKPFIKEQRQNIDFFDSKSMIAMSPIMITKQMTSQSMTV